MNPITFIWAHPRPMSTAIELVLRERGDLDCLHEPLLHYCLPFYHKLRKHNLTSLAHGH